MTPPQLCGYPHNFEVMDPDYGTELSNGQARRLVALLCTGGLVVLCSDCGYAVVADPRSASAVAALDLLLDHSRDPIPLTVATDALAATLLDFGRPGTAQHDAMITLTGQYWPGRGLGIGTQPNPSSRQARVIQKNVHAAGGVLVARVSGSRIERHLSETGGVAYTSAALRRPDRSLITDSHEAYNFTLAGHQAGIPWIPTVFVRLKGRVRLNSNHSTIISLKSVSKNRLGLIRESEQLPKNEVHQSLRAIPSLRGVDWSDAT